MHQPLNRTDLIQHADGLRQRLDALDLAATGISDGMRYNTITPESAYQLLDVLAADFKGRADSLLALLT